MQINTVLDIPPQIAKGVATGIYTRIGGTIRDSQTGQIVALLRETAPAVDWLPGVTLATGVLNFGVSILNLGVSVVGFSLVLDRLGRLERELQSTKEILLKSNQELARKIDLSFYANFAAALKLAQLSFTMSDPDNRRVNASQAINRFLESEEIYSNYARNLLESKTRGAEQYLFTLALAYVAEIRCYLEMEAIETAQYRHREVVETFRPLVRAYVKLLLTSKPCVYLHSELEDETSLTRLTNIIRWLKQKESISENSVFQRHRKDIFTLHREGDYWKNSLPDAVWEHIEFKGFPGTYKQLPKLMDKMEAVIETFRRLEAYGQEIQVIQQLEISFREWVQLSGSISSKDVKNQLFCVLLPE